jgi:threonylcarbamoyladenosine tRNA methylthiotransferase MtaB
MKRKYTQQDVMQSLEKIYKKIPQVHVGMDVIVGFPNETDELFLDTYQTLQNLPWTKIHVFPYSERPGTKAMQYTETVRREVRLQRAAQLRHLSQARYGEEAHKQLGQIKKVLLLKNSNKNANALSRDYWQVQVESDPSSTWLSGTEVQVRLKDYIQGVSTIGEGYFSSELVMAEGL